MQTLNYYEEKMDIYKVRIQRNTLNHCQNTRTLKNKIIYIFEFIYDSTNTV